MSRDTGKDNIFIAFHLELVLWRSTSGDTRGSPPSCARTPGPPPIASRSTQLPTVLLLVSSLTGITAKAAKKAKGTKVVQLFKREEVTNMQTHIISHLQFILKKNLKKNDTRIKASKTCVARGFKTYKSRIQHPNC